MVFRPDLFYFDISTFNQIFCSFIRQHATILCNDFTWLIYLPAMPVAPLGWSEHIEYSGRGFVYVPVYVVISIEMIQGCVPFRFGRLKYVAVDIYLTRFFHLLFVCPALSSYRMSPTTLGIPGMSGMFYFMIFLGLFQYFFDVHIFEAHVPGSLIFETQTCPHLSQVCLKKPGEISSIISPPSAPR